MDGEQHFFHYGVRYTSKNVYGPGAQEEERKKIAQHKRYVTGEDRGPKNCNCKAKDEDGSRCNKISELDKNGNMINPRGNCPNASYHYECREDVCGPGCQNMLLRNFWRTGRMPPVTIKNTGIVDLGLFASKDIPAKTVLGEYTGFVRCHKVGETDVDSNYAFGVGTGFKTKYDLLIDASEYGNYLRFCNHSCQPNCSTQEIIVDNSFHILVMTKELIPKDTEITISYGEGYFRFGVVCHCASNNCRSNVTGDAAS